MCLFANAMWHGFFLVDVASSTAGQGMRKNLVTSPFIPLMMSSSLVFITMTSSFSLLIGWPTLSHATLWEFPYFRAIFKCTKVMSHHFQLNSQTYQMCFSLSQLDTICVKLALAITSAGQTRYELLGLIAAGEYTLLNFSSSNCVASKPVALSPWLEQSQHCVVSPEPASWLFPLSRAWALSRSHLDVLWLFLQLVGVCAMRLYLFMVLLYLEHVTLK